MKSRLVITLLVLASLVGCVRIDIGGEQTPTLGDQLMDLYEAKRAGVISEVEFDALRRELLGAL